MTRNETFTRRVFSWAGIYGIAVLLPQYFMEARIAHDYPPAITHPEHFYGFIGVALAWQIAFLAISRQPRRLRPVMVAAAAEKFLFAGSTAALLAASRAPAPLGVFAAIDLLLGILFLLCFIRLKDAPQA